MRGDLPAQKRVWGAVFDMPTLLQRGKPASIPVAERHHHWKLGLRDWDGAAVPHGGWGFTGSISTDGVSLCAGLWRPRQHQGQELGSRPTPVHPGPVERAAMANQETPMAPNTICLGIDTGVRNAIVAIIPTVRRECHICGADMQD
jgi:hypothetical protein